jgi:hypothetical protein
MDACDKKLLLMFDSLTSEMISKSLLKQSEIPSDLVFKLLSMKDNNRSPLFLKSALWIDETIVEEMLENGLLQVVDEQRKRYALTFKGIAKCIELKYGLPLGPQYSEFLNCVDKIYSAVDQSCLKWQEKLATLSFLLMGATSKDSAIRLISENNVKILTEVFEKTLECLKKYQMIGPKVDMKTGRREETPLLYLINRLQDLPKRTSHYYRSPGDSVYFLDVEEEGKINSNRIQFLLKRVFEEYDKNCMYKDLEQDLQKISLRYSPSFLERKILQKNLFEILGQLAEFMTDIHHLPHKT